MNMSKLEQNKQTGHRINILKLQMHDSYENQNTARSNMVSY